jgi:hypothetical protein
MRNDSVSVQERLEGSSAGRAAISVLIVVTVLSVVVWNLPESELKRQALEVVRPYVLATGLEQNWGVFSPDPRRQTLDLVARVRFADGSEETLIVPRSDRFVGVYWDYRWLKWVEWATSDAQRQLWQPAAAWFAHRAGADGRRPVSVTLVRRWHQLLPPGDGPERGGRDEYAYYTYQVPEVGAR